MRNRSCLVALASAGLALVLVQRPASSLAAEEAPLRQPLPPPQPIPVLQAANAFSRGANPFAGMSGERAVAEREAERDRNEIETDRDSFTPVTTTAGRGRLIFESAYSFIDNRAAKETHSFPEAIFRYGVTDWLEVRLGANYEAGGAGNEVTASGGESEFGEADRGGSWLERESRILYGAKVRVSEQRAWLPASALMLQGVTPTSGPSTDALFTGTYVFGWVLDNRGRLDAAIRYGTGSEGEDRFGVWAPSVVFKVPLTERLNAHAEYFALFSRDKAQEFNRQFVSPGVHYLITPDFEVGVRIGWGLNDQSARFFANAGVGWRF